MVGGQRKCADEPRDAVVVARRGRVSERVLVRAVGLAPVRRPTVHLERAIGLPAGELGAQHAAKQAVVAIAVAAPVKRAHEEISRLEVLERGRRPGREEGGVAERPGERLELGRTREEAEIGGRQIVEELEPDVVADEAIPAAELLRRSAREDRQRGQVEPGRPSFRAVGQLDDRGLVESDAGAAEQEVRLAAAEGKVGRAELEEPPLGTDPSQGQVGQEPAAEDERRSGRHVVRELRECLDCVAGVDRLHLVEDEYERLGAPGERGAEPRGGGTPDGRTGAGERSRHPRVEGLDPVERRGDVAEKRERVVVALVERHPGERALVTGGPLGKDRRLPIRAVPRPRPWGCARRRAAG